MIVESEEAARGWIGDFFTPTPDQWAKLERFVDMLVAEKLVLAVIANGFPHQAGADQDFGRHVFPRRKCSSSRGKISMKLQGK